MRAKERDENGEDYGSEVEEDGLLVAERQARGEGADEGDGEH